MSAATSSPARNHYAVKVAPRSFSNAAPKCTKCDKSVYAAEQVVGPASKIYHKVCLKCTECGKTLDALHLVEHDTDPYCKPCHGKLFGPKGFGFGGSMGGDYVDRYSPTPSRSPSIASPAHGRSSNDILAEANAVLSSPTRRTAQPSSPLRDDAASPTMMRRTGSSPLKPTYDPYSAPILSTRSLSNDIRPDSPMSASDGSSASSVPPRLPGLNTLRDISGGPDRCRRCGDVVYFAEQIRAAGQKWHKRCLRCAKCSKTLDSHLVVSEDLPYCRKCHSEKSGIAETGYMTRPSLY